MSQTENPEAAGILNAFLIRYLEDQEGDGVEPLGEYQKKFPGYEDLIEKKYVELTRRGETLDVDMSSYSLGRSILADLPSEEIGPYKLLQVLGEGGMGTVFLAEQTEPIWRRVALKVIKLGMDTKEVIARFEAERQALALMDHPNIAKVFDAGSTADGRPYFVMEYVQGVSITEYCDRQRLSTTERLHLYLCVCDGIQHAHQKGIIHRDLKPSNILVKPDGEKPIPKIIDFGVSKSLNRPLSERTFFTEQGQIIGTPEYMSPEQAEMSGLDIDTRADIYALGILLYELLVGALPFDPQSLRRAGYAEIQRRIVEDEPPRPSTRLGRLAEAKECVTRNRKTDLRTLKRQVHGDLDLITMKAMAKDRTMRYASASELAADIGRHLNNEPVTAGPPGVFYQIGKFARKYRVALRVVAIMLLVFLVLVGVAMGVQRTRRIKASDELFEKGRASWETYEEQRRELLRATEAWKNERESLPWWKPVWDREEELRLRDQLLPLQADVSRLYNQTLGILNKAFEVAPRDSDAEVRARREIAEILKIPADLGRSRDKALGPEFFATLFGLFEATPAEEIGHHYRGLVKLESEPPGAEVFCFRYQPSDGRLLPLPFDVSIAFEDPDKAIVGGEFLEVESVATNAGQEAVPFIPGDRVLAMGEQPVKNLTDFVNRLRDVDPGVAVAVDIQRQGQKLTARWIPFAEQNASPDTCNRADCIASIRDQFGFTFSGYPLEFTDACRLGVTPAETQLPSGSYLLIFRRDGFLDVRVPVAIERGRANDPLRVRLLKERDTPPGFVHVPAGRFTCGGDPGVDQSLELAYVDVGDFLISRLEVTVGEYAEFLNAPENIDRIDSETGTAEPLSQLAREEVAWLNRTDVPLVPENPRKRDKLFTKRGERWVPKSTLHLDWPVLGLPMLAGAEYAHWLTQRGGRWVFRLPNDLEWEKAARGVDRRLYVWGDYPIWTFCVSGKGSRRRPPLPKPVGTHPMDESVYGVRDLAGSATEPTSAVLLTSQKRWFSLRGGNWTTLNDYFFRVANRNGRPADGLRGTDTGLRLVAELEE